MYCIHCGSENFDEARFCSVCGQRIEIEQKPTAPAAPPMNPDQGNISGAYIPSEQIWYSAPSQPTVADAPMAAPQTPFPPPFASPSSDAMLPPVPGAYGTPPLGTPSAFNQPIYPPPGTPSAFNQPTYPPVAGIPGAPVEIPQGGIGPSGAPLTPRPSGFQTLANPIPRLVLALIILLVAGIFILLFYTGSDWSAGAMHLAIGAGIIALLVALATAVRSFAGMASRANPKRVGQFIGAGLAFLLLLLLCLGGLTQQNTIHSLQARSWEGQQQWQKAINEFQLSGERAPVSESIARVYNEWGEQLAGQQRYQDAFVKYDTILNAFGSPADQVNRAQNDEINAYIGWAKQAMDAKSYSDATARYNTLLQKPYCQASCQSQVNLLDATAYYDLAEFQLSSQNYTDSVSNFATVLSRFPNSPEATKLHGDYAQALYGEGQQQLSVACNTAIPTYQQLASQFGDTSQGQQAASALKAPQPVKGRFVGSVPHASNLTDIAALMKGLYGNITSGPFYSILAGSPTTIINSDGTFTFKSMPQGKYDLAWGTINTADSSQSFTFSYHQNDNTPVYVANVGPLCPVDFGDINQDVPIAQ